LFYTARKFSSVAFKTEDGKIALIVLNDGANNETFNIKYNDKVQQLLYLQTL
jgi:hypothetical protein